MVYYYFLNSSYKHTLHMQIFIRFHNENILEVKSKLLVFSSVPPVMHKVQKVRVLIYRQCVKRKQTNPVCLHAVEKYEKVDSNNIHRTITKQRVKNQQIKRKQNCSFLTFVKVFKFQDSKFKIVQKNFSEIAIKKISWKTHRSWWSLHDKYGQSKEIINYWCLPGPIYLP